VAAGYKYVEASLHYDDVSRHFGTHGSVTPLQLYSVVRDGFWKRGIRGFASFPRCKRDC
jgi:hypothetical protein